ncbi:mannose-6-phosphate isomerase-like protein (cupin superfamily) [Dysgonomonas sp. PH5-45]|uniref:cupin domain-containing protein n=1 Tax=unclassified Dysgonomonas TaxID=2630389 RepID=UPI0024741944|nr:MULTISPECIES: cupin domain-containing protein [unclassified Dysgonomonas]MDH6355425.1 mannose-6-phosphate isomerase-like protein (cupin superfamily) [Dysgonomonas sp. PH5-45]
MNTLKTKSIFLFSALMGLGLVFSSCNKKNDDNPTQKETADNGTKHRDVLLKDYGAEPLVLNIEDYTSANTNFRTSLWTGKNLQVTLMSIPVGGEVGLEQHSNLDQFLRIEDGKARVLMGDTKDSLSFEELAGEDFAILVPAGKWHNIVNIGDEPLKLYSIYAPAEHPHSTVHKTQQEAMEAEHHH